MKRIALLGNMNNNLFNLCRFLLDRGFFPTLYIFPYDSTHFLPEADAYDDSYKAYVKNLSWGNPYELGKVSRDEIRDELSAYDFIIGCGTAPAFLEKAGLTLDMFTPYGSDLYHYPFFNILRPAKLFRYLNSFFTKREQIESSASKSSNWGGYFSFVYKQRQGIRKSKNIAVLSSGVDIYGKSLKRLNFKNNYYRFSVPMIYTGQYNLQSISEYYSKSAWFEKFQKIREQSDFLIFTNTRHCWKYEEDPESFKGNDRLYKGFSEFIKNYSSKVNIITFAYGADYPETKKLCEELKIADRVHWFPVLPRKELLVGMSLSDIVVGNLSDASWSTYGVVYESMALSKPIMHHRNDSLYPKETLYPMINAYTPDMVAKSLIHYATRKDELKKIGEGAHRWFIEESINKPVQQIVDLINNKKS